MFLCHLWKLEAVGCHGLSRVDDEAEVDEGAGIDVVDDARGTVQPKLVKMSESQRSNGRWKRWSSSKVTNTTTVEI